jgi:amino acid transporter
MWIPALIVIILGFIAWRHFGSATSFALRNFIPTSRVQDMLFWSIIIFSFIGSESASLMAEEIKDARHNIPRALIFAGVTVAFCYMLVTSCVLLAIPSAESSNLNGLAQALAHTSSSLRLHGITAFAALFIVISNIGAAGAYLAAAARLPFVAGLDGYLPAAFGKLHPRFKTPWVSVLGRGLFGMLFVFLGQAGSSVAAAYDILVAIAVVITMVPFMFLFASMIRLQNRRRFPDQFANNLTPKSFTSFTSKVLGLVGFTTAAFATFLSLILPAEEPQKLLYLLKLLGSTAALIALGFLIFHLGRRRHTLRTS